MTPATTPPAEIAARVAEVDWTNTTADLDNVGIAAVGQVLDRNECHDLSALYDQPELFRSTIDMARHRFGEGQYRYFARPLPLLVDQLRASFWPHLLPIAREWAARLKRTAPWPDDFDEWIAQCHAAGQTRPTPLMLRYRPGDWNALHRDLYGDLVFPLQVVIGLDSPGTDYTGGEFVVVEQRPRAQSRATTRTIPQGHGIVFTTRDRPIASTARGWTAAPMRHGVSVLHAGQRRTLGLVFHDAT
ncbi:MAG: hypothetical protein JWM34_4027 [Ilumatobacteraceae bacterium]|nr:hypothetical protein [Ilumatobacteraceae bacterium]